MSNDGFTLVEAVVCLAVVGILGFFSFPVLSSMKANIILQAETRKLVSQMQRARFAAIMKNSYVVFTYNERGYETFVDDGSGGGVKNDRIRQPGEQLLSEYTLDPQVRIQTNESTFQYDRALFSWKTGVKGGSIILQENGGAKNKITMNMVGRLLVKKL